MKHSPPALSSHRLARFVACMRLWLQALGAGLLVLLQVDPAFARRSLARTARLVAILVFQHARRRVSPPPRIGWRRRGPRAGVLRAIIGVRLRRRLRGRDPIARFFAILEVMRDFESEVARLCRRLKRGLTRRRPILAGRERARPAPLAPRFAPVFYADTS